MGLHRRADITGALLGASRLQRILMVTGASLALVASGMGLQHGIEHRSAAAALASAAAVPGTAAADPQAGNLIGRSSDAPTKAAPEAAAGAIPGSQEAAAVGAEPPPLAAADDAAAAAIAVHIPKLNLNQPLVDLHVQADQTLSVPTRFSDIGWWKGGPQPGAPGATVVAGHVTSRAGPAVFARLKDLADGDRIVVDRADKTSATFQVVGKSAFPRTDFPDQVVYRTGGKPSLHLVTCDGPFNSSLGQYPDNLVVFADLVSTEPTH